MAVSRLRRAAVFVFQFKAAVLRKKKKRKNSIAVSRKTKKKSLSAVRRRRRAVTSVTWQNPAFSSCASGARILSFPSGMCDARKGHFFKTSCVARAAMLALFVYFAIVSPAVL